MKKIKNLIEILLNTSFIFKNPEKKDIVIFDNESLDLILPLCKDYKYFVLKNRHYNIDKLYISFDIIFYILQNLFKSNLSTIYFSALIEKINPKLVVTIIDNSGYFSNVAKLLHHKYKFLAVQGAARYEIRHFSNKFFIPEFACFGEYEKDSYNQHDSTVGVFNYCGSLKQSYYLKSNIRNSKKNEKYDIALLAEASPGWSKEYPYALCKKLEETIGKTALYTLRLAKKNKLRLIFVGKGENSHSYQREILFYKKYLSEDFYIQPRFKEDFSSYVNTENSKLIIGMASTLLRENLGAGRKVLSCNFANDQIHNFPVDGICNFKNDNFEEFEKRVLKILSLSHDEYFKNLNKGKNYVMRYDTKNHAYNLIEKRIQQIVENNKS